MSEWKNIEKELPERTGEYLVTVYLHTEMGSWKKIRTANYNVARKKWFVRQNKNIFEFVSEPIAWMELPKPYDIACGKYESKVEE